MKKSSASPAGPARDPTTERVRELRRSQVEVWMELRGFAGNFDRNGLDFLANELGFTRDFLAAVLGGTAHLGTRAALAMRRAIRGPRVAEFDYRAFTELVYELLGLGEPTEPAPHSSMEPPPMASEVPQEMPGQRIVIVLGDGSKTSVVLPAGTMVDGQPTVLFGRSETTGSLTLLLVRGEQPAVPHCEPTA